MATPVVIEVGARKVFASALDWPGWSRSARSEDAALEALADYAARYRPVAQVAGVAFGARAPSFDVVEVVPGTATTDFGAPDVAAAAEAVASTAARARRTAALVDAAWETFDAVVACSSPTLRRGPRGGGRDRDEIVAHVVESHRVYLRKIGVAVPPLDPFDSAAVAAMREATATALRGAREPGPATPKGWVHRYAARRMAWHFLDHAWEIEDKRES